MKDIVERVCDYMDVSVSELRGKSRKGNIVLARKYVSFLGSACGFNDDNIALAIMRDRCTAFYHIKTVLWFVLVGEKEIIGHLYDLTRDIDFAKVDLDSWTYDMSVSEAQRAEKMVEKFRAHGIPIPYNVIKKNV